ncbi:hypothetical protein PF005_g22240 [Phytophthora fragariae]|uniref:Retrotransposon gag domain-containing protein n=1 Tax=Phytophthora fragariae TaxID=53985 RepID=A0A6A3X142_9STRA|nr:hypothetical protein PF003_g1762 [Phytophthora fragariae]KAE8925626.1 hypothetical protein PF009_g24170 [Phytophthora fragariae]KAE8981766.1 hypothetical protein PF011_g21898 [Phytophthora fragariae]KAE9092116.1 hypothetical protein PF007_g18647 [Phytophthora fragariae]KAE9101201.1 hypothetical protein PF006_g22726 [Phytophthora fragariae]
MTSFTAKLTDLPARAPSRSTAQGHPKAPTNDYNSSTMVSQAVKVLPMFYSDTATVEKSRDFWELFEDHTDGFPDRSRLLVFRQKIKGRKAERWWNNSRIKSFRTLNARFHNQFLSRTADELWERLETTKRERGESVEEWGDRGSDLCESLDYPNPQMRYQLFRRELRNKRMMAMLDASPASDISDECEWLMFKDMYHPIEEDDEFSEGESVKKSKSKPAGSALVEALTQQLKTFMEQQQQWHQRLAQQQWQPHGRRQTARRWWPPLKNQRRRMPAADNNAVGNCSAGFDLETTGWSTRVWAV